MTRLASHTHMQVAWGTGMLAMQEWVMGDSASLGMRRKEVSLIECEDAAAGDDDPAAEDGDKIFDENGTDIADDNAVWLVTEDLLGPEAP